MRRLCTLVLLLVMAAPAGAFDVVGHRGSRGYRPENTVRAFQTAVAIGATAVEADLVLTRDGHVVISHDFAISPLLCSGPFVGWLIKDLTLSQVRRHDCGGRDPDSTTQTAVPGQRIPTLRRLLSVMKPTGAHLLLEIKVDPTKPRQSPARLPLLRRVRDAVRRQNMIGRVGIQSYDWRSLRLLHLVEPRLDRIALASRFTAYPGSPWLGGVRFRRAPDGTGLVDAAGLAGFNGLAPDMRLVTPEMVAAAHDRGLRVLPYTVDEVDDMVRLIGLGVDGLITDFPDIARDQARQLGVTR